MGSKLLDENKQPLSENRHFKSFQTSPVSSKTKMQQEDVADLTSPMGKKELDKQTKEVAIFPEYKCLKHQQVLCSEDIKKLQVCLQEPLKILEERNKKLIKEKTRILEGRELIKKQEKILKDMQIKINHLHKQLKHPELIESQEREKVYNCPSPPTQKTAMVKQTQKSSHQKKFSFSLGKSVSYLLCYACLYLTLVLVYKHLPDPIWTYQLDTPDSISHQPWTH